MTVKRPSVAETLAPLLANHPVAERRVLVALAERVAAGRYRAWAAQVERAALRFRWRLGHRDYRQGEGFTDEQLDYMDATLAQRETLFAEVLPWPNVNFGTDPWWCRTWPYEQEAAAANVFAKVVRFLGR